MTDEFLSEAFAALVAYSMSEGAKRISELPGCWENQIDEQWWVAINGHREDMKCSKGANVPGFHAYVEFNGWPAGFFSPRGGTFAAGTTANEDAFIEAVLAATRKETP